MREEIELAERVANTILDRGLANYENPVLLMVSGGSDSTALAYIANDLRARDVLGPLAILHVNHELRGVDADEDAQFVQKLGAALGIPTRVVNVDVATIAQEEHGNIEAIARRERYRAADEALTDLCLHEDAPLSQGRIFVAHTADDRIENFYMRSIVGTGPGGFRSMLYLNGNVARPLLDIARDELRAWIEDCAQSGAPVVRDERGALWREDATNEHTDRFRAFVRTQIVPRAKERNPRLVSTLTRTMNLIADEDDLLDDLASDLYERFVVWLEDGEGCVIAPWLAAERVPLQRRVVVKVLEHMLGADARVETASVDAVTSAFVDGKPLGGYVTNIQGNLAVSANRNGVRIEPMAAFRARRKRD